MRYAIQPRDTVGAQIAGTDDLFPIGRVFCVGRNYEAHAREMGKDPERDPPFFFTKFPDAYVPTGADVPYPPGTSNYHHEIELTVAIGKAGRNITEADAFGHIFGYATSLDMTRRDLQLDAREKGRPWDTGKSFEHAMPMAPIHLASETGKLVEGSIELKVNGEIRQTADLSELIWSVDEIIAHLSRLYTLEPGDLIMTGTPAGVGPVAAGDVLHGQVAGLTDLETRIVEAI
ncbi:MAG: fumarylacetoacetate hydrolase family protein [Pseudomonadota bacterium]